MYPQTYFNKKIPDLMTELEFVCTYLDDAIPIHYSTSENHLYQLAAVLQRLPSTRQKIHAENSSIPPIIEHLGQLLTNEGINTGHKNMQVVLDLHASTTLKQLRISLGIVQFYRDMWKCCSHNILAPLTDLV